MSSTTSVRHSPRSDSFDNRAHAVVGKILEGLGTPRALTVWLLLKHDEHKQLVELSTDPSQYLSPSLVRNVGYLSEYRFRLDYAASRLLAKCANLNTGIDTKLVAIESALEAEELCRGTNKRLRDITQRELCTEYPEFLRARDIVYKILGPRPSSIFEMEDRGWSPGRTSSCYGEALSSMHKYAGRLDVTSSAYGIGRNLVCAAPNWGASALHADGPCSPLYGAFNFVRGNTMIVVPKNAKTDRTICYEPHLNVRAQLIVGGFLRSRLALHGVNLNDQSINSRRARLGSKHGHLATIDLSSASDTVCVELVRLLLPPDWFFLLDRLRSHETFWEESQSWKINEKFSSMGNGFTFELESLLFYALASAVSSNVSVYGDDIVVPTDKFTSVCSVLRKAGFVLNERKSFGSGAFRESCGGDYFAGLDCTPVYIRSLPHKHRKGVCDETEWFMKVHNAVRRYASVIPQERWSHVLRYIRTIVPSHLGPSGKGDGHYHVNVDEATPVRHRTWDGWLYRSVTRDWKVNHHYGDRVFGRYSEGFGFAALCAATGPKRPRDIVATGVDRRHTTVKVKRMFSHLWESIVWF